MLTFKKINLPKIDYKKLIEQAKKLPTIIKSTERKTLITAGIIIAVLAITIAGREAPGRDKWEDILPEDALFSPDLETFSEETDDNMYTAFFFEVYDLILEKYWNILSEEQMGSVVKLAIEKLIGAPVTAIPVNKNQTRSMLLQALENKSEDEKKKFVVQLTDVVLANLEPFGRSRLYTSKKQKELSNTVQNVNPDVNHYETLAVEKGADVETVERAYQDKVSELNAQPQTPEVIQEKQKVEQAKEVLTDEGNKEVYDKSGVNPTIPNRFISPRIFYIHISKFSPTTVQELLRVMDKAEEQATAELDTLIIDIRGNIGGAIDGLPYFLGPFIGNDQYAYQFFSRGEKEDHKTLIGWLPSMVRYKKVVVLTDDQVQSSGEVFAATLKKYNVGVLVGTTTKGWGTVESVFKIKNQLDPENEVYSVLLVHSLTLREDGLPIQDKGVEPHVNINNANWQYELGRYFGHQELINAVSNLINN